MLVTFYNQQKKLVIPKIFVEKVVLTTLSAFNTPHTEVIIHLVGKRKMCSLHQQFFNDPTLTDCISFPLGDSQILGEVFVCPEVAIAYAKNHKKDPLHETALYIIHGLLHLLGYEDLTVKQAQEMRRQEKQAMKKLGLNV